MSSVNKVIIVGRLGQDPEVRQFQNGGGVTNINVATSEKWTDRNTGEPRESTEWHRISLFNRLGEIAAQYLRKGSLVYIEGSLNTRKYTDQQGIERHTTEIRASEMRMLSSANQGSGYQGGQGNWGSQGQSNNYQNNITKIIIKTRIMVLLMVKGKVVIKADKRTVIIETSTTNKIQPIMATWAAVV